MTHDIIDHGGRSFLHTQFVIGESGKLVTMLNNIFIVTHERKRLRLFIQCSEYQYLLNADKYLYARHF